MGVGVGLWSLLSGILAGCLWDMVGFLMMRPAVFRRFFNCTGSPLRIVLRNTRFGSDREQTAVMKIVWDRLGSESQVQEPDLRGLEFRAPGWGRCGDVLALGIVEEKMESTI